MREILFKAKRIDNGEWVEGSYLYCKGAKTVSFLNEHYILVFDGYGVSWVKIDKDTLCQYTGLTDKNGNKIWENDVVRLDEDIYIVTWEEADAMFALEDVGVIEHFGNADSKWCEVIGNTFDNPELMKGE